MSDKAAINTNVRLFDLVRYSRAELHHEGLITDEEYAWLCVNAPMATSPKGGSPSRQRLEDYDEIRAKIISLEADKQRMDALEEEDCWIGLKGEFEISPKECAGKSYPQTVRAAADMLIAQKAAKKGQRK
jgi:hypothetical protein